MKYIRLKIAGFVVFEEHNVHSDIANKYPHDEVLSAGQFNLYCDPCDIALFGESVSLGKQSKVDDMDKFYRRANSI